MYKQCNHKQPSSDRIQAMWMLGESKIYLIICTKPFLIEERVNLEPSWNSLCKFSITLCLSLQKDPEVMDHQKVFSATSVASGKM